MAQKTKKFVDLFEAILADLKQTARNWLLILLVSIACSYCIIVLVFRNSYNRYATGQLAWMFLLAPVIYVITAILFNRLFIPGLKGLSRDSRLSLMFLSLIIGAVLSWLVPAPAPFFYRQHTLQLVTSGERNPDSQGSIVEVRPISFIDGNPITAEQFSLSGDWQIKENALVSQGTGAPSTAEFQGMLPDGIVLRFRFKNDAGQVNVIFDGQKESFDLYSKLYEQYGATGAVPITVSAWQGSSLLTKILLAASAILFYLGIVFFVFLVCFIFQSGVLKPRVALVVLAIAYLSIFALFVQLKQSYRLFNAERIYNDTPSYIRIAEEPLNSMSFWAGERSFSLPLLYKLMKINQNNFRLRESMIRVGDVQTWLSIVSWTILGLALASQMRRRWLGPLAFLLVLSFSLSLEIGLWDRLMLSESISLSMFALMVASWLFLLVLPPRWLRSVVGVLYIILACVITILYSFARDNNIYFLAASAGVFALILIFKKAPPPTRKLFLAYTIFLVILFVGQNLSFELGNRWQFHVFDNIALRMTLDPTSFTYYKAAGLPVNDKLLAAPYMNTNDFHYLFFEDPDMQPLRDWVVAKGQSTWLKYMLTHPEYSILRPLRDANRMINGGSLEYRYSRYPYQPLPPWLVALDAAIFPRHLLELVVILGLVVAGGWLFMTGREQGQPAWLVVFLLVLTIIPLVFIYWNGNPIEIERHANQLSVQYRLAGWMALMFLVDRLALRFNPLPSI